MDNETECLAATDTPLILAATMFHVRPGQSVGPKLKGVLMRTTRRICQKHLKERGWIVAKESKDEGKAEYSISLKNPTGEIKTIRAKSRLKAYCLADKELLAPQTASRGA